MRSHFRSFDRAGLRCERVLTLTIRADCMWSLPWFAYESLGRPRFIKPTFDERTRMLKIAAARVKNKHTFAVQQQGASTFLIAASNATRRWGIEVSTAQRFQATLQEGKLLVDVSQEGEPVSRRWGKREAAKEEALAAAQPPASSSSEEWMPADLRALEPWYLPAPAGALREWGA